MSAIFCVLMAALNVPGIIDGSAVSMAACGFCLAMAAICLRWET